MANRLWFELDIQGSGFGLDIQGSGWTFKVQAGNSRIELNIQGSRFKLDSKSQGLFCLFLSRRFSRACWGRKGGLLRSGVDNRASRGELTDLAVAATVESLRLGSQ